MEIFWNNADREFWEFFIEGVKKEFNADTGFRIHL
jgi:hypothetical protein